MVLKAKAFPTCFVSPYRPVDRSQQVGTAALHTPISVAGGQGNLSHRTSTLPAHGFGVQVFCFEWLDAKVLGLAVEGCYKMLRPE
jgi:hypothetical protein